MKNMVNVAYEGDSVLENLSQYEPILSELDTNCAQAGANDPSNSTHLPKGNHEDAPFNMLTELLNSGGLVHRTSMGNVREPQESLPVLMDNVSGNSKGSTAGGVNVVDVSSNSTKSRARTSKDRGVTRHKSTFKYEAHLWDYSCKNVGKHGRRNQVYLGGYNKEEDAARAYDLAAIKYRGTTAKINFPLSTYEKELKGMQHMTKQQVVASILRESSGFSRGASKYRGVAKHRKDGKWQARVGSIAGYRDLYLGSFESEEEAAQAYDLAAIKLKGLNCLTNFEIFNYDVDNILAGNINPPRGPSAKLLKIVKQTQNMGSFEETMANNDQNIPTQYYSEDFEGTVANNDQITPTQHYYKNFNGQ